MPPGAKAVRSLLGRRLAGSLPGRRFIFVYHDVSEPDAPQHSPLHSTRPASFAAQIELLAGAFELVALDDLVRDTRRLARPRAAITFDDGFSSVGEVAEPFLTARGIPFTLFVCDMALDHGYLPVAALVVGRHDDAFLARVHAACFAGDGPSLEDFLRAPAESVASYEALNAVADPAWAAAAPALDGVLLSADEVAAMHRRGVTVGSHSATHPVLSHCDDAALERQIDGSARRLSRLLGERVRHFAIPFGQPEHFDERVLRRCAQAGFEHVYGGRATPVRGGGPSQARVPLLDEGPSELRYKLNRALVTRRRS